MLSAKVEQIFSVNGGVLRLEQAPSFGVSKEAIRKMYHRGDLEKVHSGVYIRKDDLPDELVLIQSVYPKGIISHESAARLYGLTRFTPSELILSFPQGYKLNKNQAVRISPYFVGREQYNTGIERVETWEGNQVFAYNQEKTLIDLARSRYTLPLIFQEAAEGYLAFGNRDFDRLIAYSRQFNIEEKINQEVLAYAE